MKKINSMYRLALIIGLMLIPVCIEGAAGPIGLGREAVVEESSEGDWLSIGLRVRTFTDEHPAKPSETLVLIDMDETVGIQVKTLADRTKNIFVPIRRAAETIKSWQDKGYIVLALTARQYNENPVPGELGGKMAGNVPSDLQVVGIDYDTQLINDLQLNNFGNHLDNEGYLRGVIYAGTNKGVALQQFLNNNPQLRDQIKKIIFIDDSKSRINEMKEFLDRVNNNGGNKYDGFLEYFTGAEKLTALASLWEKTFQTMGEGRNAQDALVEEMRKINITDPTEQIEMAKKVFDFDKQVKEITQKYKEIHDQHAARLTYETKGLAVPTY